jgi:hypothetical protein
MKTNPSSRTLAGCHKGASHVVLLRLEGGVAETLKPAS